MVVRTRSSYTSSSSAAAAPAVVVAAAAPVVRRRSTRLSTPSYTQASIRSYKIYTPVAPPARCVRIYESEDDSEQESEQEYETYEAAETLVSMSRDDDDAGEAPTPIPPSFQCGSCLNPMSPVTRYIYKLSVYNMDQTSHYNTSYIVYNSHSRTYHVYSIISTMLSSAAASSAVSESACGTFENTLPEPTNTIQTKYSTYVNLESYVMNLIIPSPQREYSVLADFVGVVGSDDDFKQCAFRSDSCYYDIDSLWNTTDSKETITGHKMFILTPTRVYYWDAGAGIVPTSSMYTVEHINSALNIIATIH
jgi:hypothetical protein